MIKLKDPILKETSCDFNICKTEYNVPNKN